MLGLDDDGDTARSQRVVDGAGDLVGQPFLYLETPRASFDNLTPADLYLGRGEIITLERQRIKRETIKQRRLLHREAAA